MSDVKAQARGHQQMHANHSAYGEMIEYIEAEIQRLNDSWEDMTPVQLPHQQGKKEGLKLVWTYIQRRLTYSETPASEDGYPQQKRPV